MARLYVLFITFTLLACQHKEELAISNDSTLSKEQIIDTYLRQGAWEHHYLSHEWDKWIDRALEQDSSIALLWHHKALPLWKQQQYAQAIAYYNKAVALEPEKWLSRLAFLKCIFAKDYQGALQDLKLYKQSYGNTYEQDHSLDFYMGICHLQMGAYDMATDILLKDMQAQEERFGSIHFFERFYLAIAYYEQQLYQAAIEQLDLVLSEYDQFSDAQFYKAICLAQLGEQAAAKALLETGKKNYQLGYTINEDSAIYEKYPYQVTWQWDVAASIAGLND